MASCRELELFLSFVWACMCVCEHIQRDTNLAFYSSSYYIVKWHNIIEKSTVYILKCLFEIQWITNLANSGDPT